MTRVEIEPVLHAFKGWNMDSTQIKSPEMLPSEMKSYVDFINEYLGVNVHYISNGPGRDQLIRVQ